MNYKWASVFTNVHGILFRRVIYSSKLDGSETKIFYVTNHIIDGMALDVSKGQLYWTDYLTGTIATVQLSGKRDTYQEMLTGLSQPRALVIDEQNR